VVIILHIKNTDCRIWLPWQISWRFQIVLVWRIERNFINTKISFFKVKILELGQRSFSFDFRFNHNNNGN